MNNITVGLSASPRATKKWRAVILYNDGKKKTIHFGQFSASDFLDHKNEVRRLRYINRHQKLESKYWTHTKLNLQRPSYWSRFLLWNKPTLRKSIKFIEDKQNIKIKLIPPTQ